MPANDLIGFVASGFVLLSFSMKSMVALRLAALAGNLSFILYAVLVGLVPVLLLHLALLPINLWRLWQLALFRQGGRLPWAAPQIDEMYVRGPSRRSAEIEPGNRTAIG